MKRPLLVLAIMLILGNSARLAAQVSRSARRERMEAINAMLDARTFPHFDSLGMVAAIDSIAQQGDEEVTEYARYFCLHLQAYLIKDADALLKRLIDIGTMVATYKTDGIKALHKFRLGDFFFNKKKYTQGLDLMLEGESQMSAIGFEKIPFSAQLLNILPTYYFNFQDYRHAIEYATLAHKYATGALGIGSLNTWGRAYQRFELYGAQLDRPPYTDQ